MLPLLLLTLACAPKVIKYPGLETSSAPAAQQAPSPAPAPAPPPVAAKPTPAPAPKPVATKPTPAPAPKAAVAKPTPKPAAKPAPKPAPKPAAKKKRPTREERVAARKDAREDRREARRDDRQDARQARRDERKGERRAARGRETDGERVAKAAAHYIGKTSLTCNGKNYRYDCSGFVNVSYARAGYDLGLLNTAALYDLAKEEDLYHRRRRPLVGDVVFFDNTYDRNGNGKLDDPLSHVAIVESIDDDGTITLIHKGSSKGVVRIVMNLEHPEEARSPEGKVWNSHLRGKSSKDPRGTEYLTGQLWVGNASFWSSSALVATDDDEK
ncbi:MAG: CHAP domain-containing protein [Deltaproteobacteria bacterium]|nr:CHAP domain-containing protein [Deltaproteobacteria bacterium]